MRNDGTQISAIDVIHAAMRLGIPQTRAAELARELGVGQRDIDFARMWREEWGRFDAWRQQTQAQ